MVEGKITERKGKEKALQFLEIGSMLEYVVNTERKILKLYLRIFLLGA